MRRLRRCAGLLGILLATACGRPDAGTETTLSAAGAAGAEPAPTVTSSTSSTTAQPATTVAPTTTVRPAPATTATTAVRRSPPPLAPPPTISAGTVPTIPTDTYLAASTTVTEGSTTATLKAVPEQYLGEKVYVWVEATSTERITSIRIDFGDGYVTTEPKALPSHVSPAAGRYRITVTLPLVPGIAAPKLPPSPPTEMQWLPTGPEHAVTVSANLRQRPDAAPPGYPRLPTVTSE